MKRFSCYLLSIFTIFCFAFAFFGLKTAKADTITEVATDIFLPGSYEEYFPIQAPTDVYKDGEVTAFIEDAGIEKQFTVYKDDKYSTYTNASLSGALGSTVIQIKRYNDLLIIQDSQRPHAFNIETGDYTELKTTTNDDISCDYFAINDNYLVSVNNTELNVYTLSYDAQNATLSIVSTTKKITGISKQCVAINENNDIFYFKGSDLYKADAETMSGSLLYAGLTPKSNCTSIVATANFVFLNNSTSIDCINVITKEKTILLNNSVSATLGEIKAADGLCFYGNTLYVADSALNAIEGFSFSLKSGAPSISFTGFAITAGFNAPNRLTVTAKDVAVYGDTVCVLDSDKLTLSMDGMVWSVKFTEFDFSTAFSTIDHLSFNGEKALLCNADRITLVDIENKTALEYTGFSNPNVEYTAYADGYFYLLFDPNGNSPQIARISEDNFTTCETIISLDDVNDGDKITVDVDGNIYYYFSYNGIKKIVKYTEGENGYTAKDVASNISTLIKMQADLDGNVYCLFENNKVVKYASGLSKEFAIKLNENLVGPFVEGDASKTINASAFALNFDSQDVFFLFGNDGLSNTDGFMVKTAVLENVAITNVANNGLSLSDSSAKNVEDFKFVEVEKQSNLYLIDEFNSSTEKFTYKELVNFDENKTFVLIGETAEFYVVADEVQYLVKKSQAEVVAPDLVDMRMATAYTTTAVNAYYLPIMTRNDLYVLSGVDRLSKATELVLAKKVSFNGTNFYFATIKINGNDINCFVPSTFVTTDKASVFETYEFTFKTVNATKRNAVKVFTTETLEGEIFTITEKTKVKVLSEKDGVALIEFTATDGTFVKGYVKANVFIKDGDSAVRNAIIISLLATSAFATSLFFILRRKRLSN